MSNIGIEYKTKLGELLAAGHKRFGKVNPRKPYREDDESGGSGIAKLSPFEQHPLLVEQPDGAPSDLTAVATENNDAVAEVEKRDAKEISNQMQEQLTETQTHTHTHSYGHAAKPAP